MENKFAEIMKLFESNPSLKEAVLEAQRKAEAEGLPVAEYAKQICELLSGDGISLSAEEAVQLIEKNSGVQISDDELHNVSGGCGGGGEDGCNCHCKALNT